jgi:hypothetical protein
MTRYRQARRAGLQPMMMINSGEPLPDLAAVVIARWAWRYRSELAPLGIACLVATFGWYARAALSPWWPLILTAAGLAAWVLAAFGARFGLSARLERLYAAVTVLACGTWDAVAAAAGPLTPPLPQALGIGALVLSVPWWANRRRRAKVRVERTIATWPDIAAAVGLAGSQIMSAAARPSPTSSQRYPRSNLGSARTATRSASPRLPMTSPTAANCASWTTIRTPTRSRGTDHRSPRSPSRSTWDRSKTPNPAACFSCADMPSWAARPARARAAA